MANGPDGRTPSALERDSDRVQRIGELAEVLRRLRRREARRRGDAELTYRQLAAKTGWSHAIIGQYFSGNVLPPTDRFDTLVMLLGATPTEQGALATARDRVAEAGRSGVWTTPRGTVPRPTPQQLPVDVYGFTGRDQVMAELDALLDEGRRTSTAVISAVSGTAGVGKTALAVHWARRVAHLFPDGQLYVNLRGFDPTGSALAPAEAVRAFLEALGVSPVAVPATFEAQVSLYRSLLADKRVLVVLDNARDSEQAAPLLPAAPTCLALVTSRNELAGLVAGYGGHLLTLDLLSSDEARQMLSGRLGHRRVAAEPDAAEEIIDRCARLPLALAIVAARAAAHRTFPLAALAAELRETRSGLAPWSGPDRATDMRAVLSSSYDAVGGPAARLFRLLGLHPGPDFGVPAAAAIAGVPEYQARQLLAELATAHLIDEHAPGRYTFHDLLRAYATEQTLTRDTDAERRVALHGLLDQYLYTAYPGAILLNPHREALPLAPARSTVTTVPPSDYESAMSWFTVEHPALVAAVTVAAHNGFETHAWQLAWSLLDFLDRQGYWQDWTATHQVAVSAAQQAGDELAEAFARRNLARAYARLERHDEAHGQLQHALDLYHALGDRVGQANTHHILARVVRSLGRCDEALRHSELAFDLYLAAGHRNGQGYTLNSIGWYNALLGNHRAAVGYCKRALTLFRELAERTGEADTWDTLGYAHHHLGEHDLAIDCYRHALDIFRQLEDRYFQAETLSHLGDAHDAAGERDSARTAWQSALRILENLGHPDAERVRTKLTGAAPGR